jgi:hypothetical protein
MICMSRFSFFGLIVLVSYLWVMCGYIWKVHYEWTVLGKDTSLTPFGEFVAMGLGPLFAAYASVRGFVDILRGR